MEPYFPNTAQNGLKDFKIENFNPGQEIQENSDNFTQKKFKFLRKGGNKEGGDLRNQRPQTAVLASKSLNMSELRDEKIFQNSR